jgi:GNAT superfamily N-acetyltransferase
VGVAGENAALVTSLETLRDGAQVAVRPIEAADRQALNAAFENLSAQSRYTRFLMPMTHLTSSMLRYLTDVDHHDHEALVAIDPATEALVGVARYVKTGHGRAEAAVTVADEWQGRGVGTLLLERLADRARAEGVCAFTALVLAHNDAMIALLRALGPVRQVSREMGAVEIEADLGEAAVPEQLRELMRQTAAGKSRLAASGSDAPRGSRAGR